MSAKKAIICVDDEKIILDSIKEQLKHHLGKEYLLEFSDNPEEALQVIEELEEEGIKIMVVVSDWLMPGMKGDEFLIKVHKENPDIVKVMLTGQADTAAIERVKKEANLFRLLLKPWKEADLVDTIRNGLMAAS
jgi:CheY-like chemotaxis protein